MHPFRAFVAEKKVYELSSKENEQVEDVLQSYLDHFDSNAIKRSPRGKKVLIGSIAYYDHAVKAENNVPVFVSFDNYAADASYDKNENSIELYYYNFNNLSTASKRNKIAHELFHAKQHFKTVTPEYRKALRRRILPSGDVTIRSERGYFFAPNEYPVQIASIVHEMSRQYQLLLQKIKTGSNIKFWENRRKSFLRTLEFFIRAPRLLEDKDIPDYLQSEKQFLKTLFRNKNNPKYSKYYFDFKKKMAWYYQNLKRIKPYGNETSDNL